MAYTCVSSGIVAGDDHGDEESDGSGALHGASSHGTSSIEEDDDGSTSSTPVPSGESTSGEPGSTTTPTTAAEEGTSALGSSSAGWGSSGTAESTISTSAFLEDSGTSDDTSSETGDPTPPSCTFEDPFDGEGTALLPFWEVLGDFPDRAYLSGTGQLQFNVNSQRVGSTVVVGSIAPTTPSYAVAVELEEIAMSDSGFEQLVFGFGVFEQTSSGPLQKYLEFQISRGDLSARTLDGTWTHHRTSVFTEDEHRHLRLRVDETGDSPLYAWETSVDGIAWRLFLCLSETHTGCIWPGAGFPADGRFETSRAEVRFIVGAYDVSRPPNPDAFSLESFSFCALPPGS